MRSSTILFCALLLAACSGEVDNPQSTAPAERPIPADALERGIEAHGGLDHWRSFGTLEFTLQRSDRTERHIVDLHSRRLVVQSDTFTIGFDGTQVWVTPDLGAYSGNARFYSSLQFYFFGLPFLLADPGTVREPQPMRSVGDKTFEVIRIGFEEGVGDSPGDYYVTHFDTASGLMDMLLYTVTYRSGVPNENYGARLYEWQEVQGLQVPSKMSSYRWNAEEGLLGEHRSDVTVTDVVFRTERPDPALFAMPDGAEVSAPPNPS